jgi:YHS domain-containing protein
MELLGRLLEFTLFVALIVWLSRKVAEWRAWLRVGPTRRTRAKTPPKAHQLFRDPWCGTYVSAEISRKLQQDAQTLHFCSQECLARYEARLRKARA